jgi:hypothetical protein
MKIEKDKLQHFMAGFSISIMGGLLINIWFGLLLGILGGLGKEIYDSFGYGCVDFLDFVFTVIGSIVGFLILMLIISF